jgi:hypothetical protein
VNLTIHRAALGHPRALLTAALAIGLLILLLAFQTMQPAVAGQPISVPMTRGANTNSGVDLVCGGTAECGPDNPAVKVAPSPKIGPKVQP